MPIVKQTKGTFEAIGKTEAGEVSVSLQDVYEPPTAKEIIKAGFRKENSLVSAVSNHMTLENKFPVVPGYDPLESDKGDIEGYELFADQFIRSTSPQETALIKQRIDQEFKDRRTLESGGVLGFSAQMAAGITDPIMLTGMFTGFGEIKAGQSVLKSLGKASLIGGSSELLAETAKHASQKTRTLEESLVNIGGATFLSGIFGGSMAGLKKHKFNKMAKAIDDNLETPEPEIHVNSEVQPQDYSFDLVSAGKIEQWGVSPLVRTSTSPRLATKEIASVMMESPLVTKGNLEGKAAAPTGGSVETRIKKFDSDIVEAVTALEDSYTAYRGGKGATKRLINDFVLRNRAGKLTFGEFRDEVGKAFRRGDKSDIPEVQQAAQAIRKKAFNPLKDQAIELKMLPEELDVKTAESYLSRIYKTKKIIAERPEWDEIVSNWLKGKRVAALAVDVAERTAEQVKDAKLTDDGIKSSIDSITNNILGTPSGRSPHSGVGKAGPLKERVFLIPDEAIEDFLESDIDMLTRQYVRTMAPDVELTRAFGDIGMEKQIEQITKEWDDAIRNEAKTAKQREKFAKQKNTDIDDIKAMRDRLQGTYRMPDDPNQFFVRAGRTLRDVNFMRMLGGMTLSAIPDPARTISVNGLKPVVKGLTTLATAPKRFNIARNQAKKMAVGLDMVLNSRASSMAEISDIYARGTAFERGLRATSDVFSKLTLMSQWNSSMKQFAGVITADRLLAESVNSATGTIKKGALRRMAQAGIGTDMAERIAKEFQKHGDDGTIKLSNAHLWTDKEAFETFTSAVLKDVDRTIITPGKGEAPLWTSSETGKLIFQFKTFASSAHHKILLADLQHRDLAALNGFLLSAALGSATYGLKNLVAGRDVSTDPEKLIVESLDRSGAFGYLWDVNNTIEKMTRGTVGINPALGAPPMSRYVSRNWVGALLGPSLGTVTDLGDIAGGVASGEFNKKDLRRLRQMLPGQNLFYMRQLLNQLEEKAGRGLPR